MIKAVLIDFDGTIVTKDILDVVCEIVGKEEESDQINRDYLAGKLTGLTPLIARINFLKGVTLSQIKEKLNKEAYLMPGSKELFSYLKEESITSIISSGNIVPILAYYKEFLDVDYIVGTHPQMDHDTIVGISEEDFLGLDFKVKGAKKILEKLKIQPGEIVAIGDSPADRTMFQFAGKSIAINPKNGVEEFANYVIHDSLVNAIPLIEGSKS